MLGGFNLVDTYTLTSATSTVTIGGGSSSTSGIDFAINTDDVYAIVFSNLSTSTDGRNIACRVTASGTHQDGGNYDYVYKAFNANDTFGNGTFENHAEWKYLFADNVGTGTSEISNGIYYLHNFNNSSEFSQIVGQMVQKNSTPVTRGNIGGGSYTVNAAHDGLYFFDDAGGNIESGTWSLYRMG